MAFRHIFITTCIAALASGAALADTLFTGEHSIDGKLCVGPDCRSNESYPTSTMKLRSNHVQFKFEDTSSTSSFPGADWHIIANDRDNGGANYLAIEDSSTDRQPFKVEDSAPSHALLIEQSGDIGLGTANPVVKLHMVDGNTPSIRMEQDGSGGFTPYVWDILANEHGVSVHDRTLDEVPFRVEQGAGAHALHLERSGNIGMGTDTPGAALHLKRQVDARMLVENTTAGTAARTLMTLKNRGRPEIVLANTANNAEWAFGAGTNFILKQGNVDSTTQAKTKVFEVSPAGDVIITGSITTQGTTCGGGCDAVFTDAYDLPTIAEHQAQMWASGYLPNVGPTPEGAPFDLTDKLGRMLNELEHAHIFIGQQADQNARLTARVATLEALVQDLIAAR